MENSQISIAIDASVLELRSTGIARVVHGLCAAVIAQDPTISFLGLHRRPLMANTRRPFPTRRLYPWLTQTLWRNAGLPFHLDHSNYLAVHFPWNTGCVRVPKSAIVISTVHDVIPLALPQLYFKSLGEQEQYRLKIKRTLDLSDIVFTDSECSKQDILRLVDSGKCIDVLYPGVELPESSRFGPPPQDLPAQYYAYIGGYDPRKGLANLVNVYRDLFRCKAVSIPLVLVGERRNFSRTFEICLDLAIAERAVIVTGYLSDEDCATLLSHARALVYPSLYEGFGYPPLEAMIVGCPVITCRNSSLIEICGDAACFIDDDTEEAIANAILTVDGDELFRKSLRDRGAVQARLFNWSRAGAQYIERLHREVAS